MPEELKPPNNVLYTFVLRPKVQVEPSFYERSLKGLCEGMPQLSKFVQDRDSKSISFEEPCQTEPLYKHSLTLGPDGLVYLFGPSVSPHDWKHNLDHICQILAASVPWQGYSLSRSVLVRRYLYSVTCNPYAGLLKLFKAQLTELQLKKSDLTAVDCNFTITFVEDTKHPEQRILFNVTSNASVDEVLRGTYDPDSFIVLEVHYINDSPPATASLEELGPVADAHFGKWADNNLSYTLENLRSAFGGEDKRRTDGT